MNILKEFFKMKNKTNFEVQNQTPKIFNHNVNV